MGGEADDATDSPLDGPFLLDAMLGKLATYLRMCGYDAAYVLDRGVEADGAVLALAREEGRMLLTRDASLASEAGDRGVLLASKGITNQLRELHDAGLSLSLADEPERCGRCNGPLERLPDDADRPGYVSGDADRPEYVPDDAAPVWRCRECGQHFWKGSHWDDVRERLDELS